MDRKKVRQHMIAEEGLKLTLYKCPADKWTIGVGHNLESRGISEAVAMAILDEDIDVCLEELQRNIPNFDEHPEPVKETLLDLCFNMGMSKLLQFKMTLQYIHEGLQTGNYTKAANELMQSNYARQLPNRAKRNHSRLFNA